MVELGELGYVVLSTLFFTASAYAQLNDPDPAIWVTLYLVGGCGLNYLSLLTQWASDDRTSDSARVSGISGADAGTSSSQSTKQTRGPSAVLERSWATAGRNGSVLFGTVLTAMMWNTWHTLSSKVEGQDLGSLGMALGGWKVLEHEEGRELAGLVLLFAHTIKIGCDLQKRLYQDSTLVTVIARLVKVCVVALLFGGVYMWVRYQPELNAAYKQGHCDGMMPLEPMNADTVDGATTSE